MFLQEFVHQAKFLVLGDDLSVFETIKPTSSMESSCGPHRPDQFRVGQILSTGMAHVYDSLVLSGLRMS